MAWSLLRSLMAWAQRFLRGKARATLRMFNPAPDGHEIEWCERRYQRFPSDALSIPRSRTYLGATSLAISVSVVDYPCDTTRHPRSLFTFRREAGRADALSAPATASVPVR